MRRLIPLAIIIVAMLLVGFGEGKLPAPLEGVTSMKLKTFTVFDLASKDLYPVLHYNFAELTDSKPDNLEIQGIDYESFTDYKFGFFRLGNNEKKVWFVMGKDESGYWSQFYIDQNLDNKITKKDQVKSFNSNEGRQIGAATKECVTLIPVPIKVSYKGITREYEQDISFYISTITFSKKEATDVMVRLFTASFLEGEMKIASGKEEKLVQFRIVDSDGNGCFNDFGNDILFMDLNNDGYFTKNESQPLTEYFESTGDEKQKKQLHLNMLPFSLKFGVTEATSEFDLAQLEPPPYQEKEPVTDQPKKDKPTDQSEKEKSKADSSLK